MFAVAALAVGLHAASVSGQLVFVVAAVALAALAWALAEATDQAGESAGPRASALLNATFGNLPEVVIVVLAIRAGLDDIARASIIGSVIGNMLLILGLSLVVGGWKNGDPDVHRAGGGDQLLDAVPGRCRPGPAHAVRGARARPATRRSCSRAGPAAALVVVYAAYLYYSFHMPALRDPGRPGGHALVAAPGDRRAGARRRSATGIVSEVLVDSIRPAVRRARRAARRSSGSWWCRSSATSPSTSRPCGWPTATGVDFAMGIAYGSGIQIVLVASAVAVFAGVSWAATSRSCSTRCSWRRSRAAALGATLVARGGETNWLEGLQLLDDLPGRGRRGLAAL